MDRIDYTFKFSTELIVFVLSFLVIGVNFAGAQTNSNLFSKLLAIHPKANLALYNKQNTIKTIVAQDTNLIPQASAQVVLASTDQISAAPQIDGNIDTIVNNNTLVKENASSTQALIAKQIHVYVTQNGDTLQSVAQKFNLNPNTIVWANNLKTADIKPGWDLIILPINGVKVTVGDNDTLPDIAKKYNADINQIISYNNLADDSDTVPGQILIIPNGVMPAPPKPKPANDLGTNHLEGDTHIFPWGQCTWYAAQQFGGVEFGGNANRWPSNARAAGYKVDHNLELGSIVVIPGSPRYGHVAIVRSIDGDTITISEMNFYGRGIVDQRDIDRSDVIWAIHKK